MRASKFPVPVVSPKQILSELKRPFSELKLRFGRRAKGKTQVQVGKRVSTFTSESRGRPIRYRIPRGFPRSNLAFLPSLIASVLARGLLLP